MRTVEAPIQRVTKTGGKPDPWLERYLEIIGRANPDGIGRGLRARACPDCFRTTLAGLDGDVAALPIRLHPAALTARGEAVALILGLRSYSIVRRGNGLNADRRDSAAIRHRPTTVIDVLHEHRCGLILPVDLYKAAPVIVHRRDADKPPF